MYVPLMYRAGIYVDLGEKKTAFEWLEKAYEEHFIIGFKVHPAFDPLRSDPRFADLLRRMKLGPIARFNSIRGSPLRHGSQRVCFRIGDLEDGVEFGDLQQLVGSRSQVAKAQRRSARFRA